MGTKLTAASRGGDSLLVAALPEQKDAVAGEIRGGAILVPQGVAGFTGPGDRPGADLKEGELSSETRYANKDQSTEKSSPRAFFSGAASRKGSPTAKFCGLGGELT